MDLNQYPVTTPFGYVAGYPLNNGFHNGIDYALPMNTPVIVNGVEIGRSNNTGASTGPHLHIGKYQNGAAQNPQVGQGTQFDHAVVFDTGKDSVNGNFVRINADGALWNYLHLADGSIKVSAGQVLQGGQENMSRDNINQEELDIIAWLATGQQARANPNFENNLGNPLITALRNFQGYNETKNLHLDVEDYRSGRLQNRIKDLEASEQRLAQDVVDRDKKIAALEGSAVPPPPVTVSGSFTDADRALATDTNNIVKQIWQKITSIFK